MSQHTLRRAPKPVRDATGKPSRVVVAGPGRSSRGEAVSEAWRDGLTRRDARARSHRHAGRDDRDARQRPRLDTTCCACDGVEMQQDDLDTKHLVVLSKREIADISHWLCNIAGERALADRLLAAPVAAPRYMLVSRDINSDGRDDLDIEQFETREELIAHVISYAISYYDDLRAFDRGVEMDNVDQLPEVVAAVTAHRAAERARYAEQTRAQREREYLRLKAEFESASTDPKRET